MPQPEVPELQALPCPGGPYDWVLADGPRVVAEVDGEENARRLVASWNALRGLTLEQIEALDARRVAAAEELLAVCRQATLVIAEESPELPPVTRTDLDLLLAELRRVIALAGEAADAA